MPNDITPQPLIYNGEVIRDRDETVNLTDMWKAAGSPANREPFNWERFEGKSFIEAVTVTHNLSETQVIVAKRGKNGGTWAHWQIGMAYAKYLDHEFHMWCNQVVRERMEGHAGGYHGLTDQDRNVIGGIVKNCAGMVVREQLAALLPSLIEPMVSARLAEQNFLIRRGKTAGQIWHAHGFPGIRVTCWFSNRLAQMGCQIEGSGRGELGLGTAKLFDPDKADLWLKNGGKVLVQEYIAKRLGQTVIKFTGRAA